MLLKRFFKDQLFFFLISILIGAIYTYQKINAPFDFKVSVTIETEHHGDYIQFYCHANHVYIGKYRSVNGYSEATQIAPNQYRITNKLACDDDVTNLRFDPLSDSGIVHIKNIRIHSNYWHHVDLEDAFKHMKPINNIGELVLHDDRITVKAIGIDPYMELSNQLQSYKDATWGDVLFFLMKYSGYAFILWNLLAFVLASILSNGPKIIHRSQQLKSTFNGHIETFASKLHSKLNTHSEFSLILLVTAFLIYCFAVLIFNQHLFHEVSKIYVLVYGFLLFHFILLFATYFFISNLNPKLKILRLLAGFTFLFTSIWLAVDASLYTLNGMHVEYGLSLLFDGGISSFFSNLRFTGLSKKELSFYVILLFSTLAGIFLFVWLCDHKWKRFQSRMNGYKSLIYVFVAIGSIFILQNISAKHLSSHQLNQLIEHQPINISFFPEKKFSKEYNIQTAEFRQNDTLNPALVHQNTAVAPDNLYLVIFESLREDMVTQEIMPNLAQFKGQSRYFERGIASGNATHFGWFSIVNGRQPYFWERYRNLKDVRGSVALQIFRHLDYRINVYSAKDLSYLRSDQVMFGEQLELADHISAHPKMSPPEHDVRITKELIQDIQNTHAQQKNLNIILLDSSHYPYRWMNEQISEIKPFLGSAAEGPDLHTAKRTIKKDKELIFNRYKNSMTFMDHLFGKFVNELKSQGLYENAVIAIVGDHGQQFMEHGFMLHGFTLNKEDIDVPIYFKAPQLNPGYVASTVSHVDILPTMLDLAGVDTEKFNYFDGHSILSDRNIGYEMSTVAGEQNTPFSFSMNSNEWNVLFRLDKSNPTGSQKLWITEIKDREDQTHIPGKGTEKDYAEFLEREFPGFLNNLPILN
ncbi:sulfatase-like hydrolase/transferase [Marinicella sp. W31]|uniref:sulfatase-like hydrolase/transferase n=1 Tax=Marinicella sp. W31 TaxID=3023713 RepID=UPI0037571E3B